MKKIPILLLLLVQFGFGQSLKIIWGDALYYQNNKEFIEIIRLEGAAGFHGYDIVDEQFVFFAHQREDFSEAIVQLKIYDISGKEEIFLGEIGATGESFFQYNPDNGLVIFNWYNGLYWFDLEKAKAGKPANIEDLFHKVLVSDNCFLPFWVDKKTIGYSEFKDNNMIIQYLEIVPE